MFWNVKSGIKLITLRKDRFLFITDIEVRKFGEVVHWLRVDWALVLTTSHGWMKQKLAATKEPLASLQPWPYWMVKNYVLREAQNSTDPDRKVDKHLLWKRAVNISIDLQHRANDARDRIFMGEYIMSSQPRNWGIWRNRNFTTLLSSLNYFCVKTNKNIKDFLEVINLEVNESSFRNLRAAASGQANKISSL